VSGGKAPPPNLEQGLREVFAGESCTKPALRAVMKAGGRITYNFVDSKQQAVTRFTLAARDCAAAPADGQLTRGQ
jgi:hypothetical protein